MCFRMSIIYNFGYIILTTTLFQLRFTYDRSIIYIKAYQYMYVYLGKYLVIFTRVYKVTHLQLKHIM